MLTKVFKEDACSQRLEELGLSEEVLSRALLAGEYFKRNCTNHYPRNNVGKGRWAEIIKSLRDQLVLDDWYGEEVNYIDLVTSRDGSISVAVSSGDDGTGLPDCEVLSRYKKGISNFMFVKENAQLAFDFMNNYEPIERRSSGELDGRQTWYLLYRVENNKIYCELSLPSNLNSELKLENFLERILLSPIDLDGEEEWKPECFETNNSEDFIVDVSLKG